MIAILSLLLVQAAEPTVATGAPVAPVATEPAISPPAEPTHTSPVSTEPVTAPSVEVVVTPTTVIPPKESQWPLIPVLIGTCGVVGGGVYAFRKKA